MQRSGETVQRGTERKERIGESRADEFSGVGRDVTAFVIRVDGDVEAKKLNKGLPVAETEEIGEIVGVILGRVDGGEFATSEDIAVNTTGNVGELGDTALCQK